MTSSQIFRWPFTIVFVGMMSVHWGKCKAGALAALLAVPLLALLFVARASPSLRVAFLYGTNQLNNLGGGVFEIVNHLNEPVTIGGGWLIPATRKSLNVEKGDSSATIYGGLRTVSARTTNIVHVWIPTNGGPYRLVLFLHPASKETPQFYRSVRVRVANLVLPWLDPSFVTQARWYGAEFVVSQSFDINQ
jgi:hypothetical protein